MGANPERKDIFIEVDYMVEPAVCDQGTGQCTPGHTHEPKPRAIDLVVTAFYTSPVGNPDGSTGINLHVVYGPNSVMNPETGDLWGALSQANSLPHDDNLGWWLLWERYIWGEFKGIKKSNFAERRAAAFHYAVFAHHLGSKCTSGISRNSILSFGCGSSDFIVSLGGWGTGQPGCASRNGVGSEWSHAGTFMHELGHNLGLRHGGGDHTNYKPNYLSVMNYNLQNNGLEMFIVGRGPSIIRDSYCPTLMRATLLRRSV